MIEEATKQAREVAQKFAADSQSQLGNSFQKEPFIDNGIYLSEHALRSASFAFRLKTICKCIPFFILQIA
jgi:hypothetical protein